MTKLPSESWYGSQPGILETQIRYTPVEPEQHRKLVTRLRLLHNIPYKTMTREIKHGQSWLRGALILLLWGVVFDNGFVIAASLTLLVYTGVGYVWDATSLMGLQYQRLFEVMGTASGKLGNPRAFLGESIKLTLRVANRKPIPLLAVEVEDSFPAGLPLKDVKTTYNRSSNRMELRSFWIPGALQTLTRHYTIHCEQRGFHKFGPAKLTTGDGFSLFTRTVVLPTVQSVIVYPKLYAVEELALSAENALGERSTTVSLFEDPLRTAGIRNWQPEDEQRRIHWPATARHQRLLSRIFEPSQALQVMIFLNCATLERYWEGSIPELAEKAISVAGSIAAHCVEKRLPAGLAVNAYWPGSDQDLRLLPGRSPAQLTRILEMLATVDLPNHPFEAHLLSEAPNLPRGATLVIVTAVTYDALWVALQHLAHTGRKLVLFTLAPAYPDVILPNFKIFHLPHLAEDSMAPREYNTCS